MHSVLEDDAADDDGDRGPERTDKAEGRSCGGDVLWVYFRLEGDEGRLEIGASADAGDDLEDDDACPRVLP